MNLAKAINEEILFQELESEAGQEVREKIAILEENLRGMLTPEQGRMLNELSDLYVAELGIYQSHAARLIRNGILQCPCLKK